MTKVTILANASTEQTVEIHQYTSVTVYCRGGTGTFTILLGANATDVVQKSTPAADTINTITDNATHIKVTPNTSGFYDIVGELR